MNNAQELINYLSKTLPDVQVTTEESTLFTSVSLYATVHHEGRSWEKSAAEWYATDLEEFRDAEGISSALDRTLTEVRERRFNVVGDYVKEDAAYTQRLLHALGVSEEYVKEYAKGDADLDIGGVKEGTFGEQDRNEESVPQLYSFSARTRPGPRFQMLPLKVRGHSHVADEENLKKFDFSQREMEAKVVADCPLSKLARMDLPALKEHSRKLGRLLPSLLSAAVHDEIYIDEIHIDKGLADRDLLRSAYGLGALGKMKESLGTGMLKFDKAKLEAMRNRMHAGWLGQATPLEVDVEHDKHDKCLERGIYEPRPLEVRVSIPKTAQTDFQITPRLTYEEDE